MKLDERSSIPLVWFVGIQAALIPVIVAGAFKVFTVDARLLRIEQKLGIPNGIASATPFVENVFGSEIKQEKEQGKK